MRPSRRFPFFAARLPSFLSRDARLFVVAAGFVFSCAKMSLLTSLKNVVSHLPVAPFRPVSVDCIRNYNMHLFSRDVSAGLTVGMVALPLAMAFGIASGVPPEAGIYTAIIAGFLISVFGGCRVQIGGPAGAFIVIIYGIIAQYGLSNLLIATIGSGIILFLMGLFKLGSFIRFIPVSIVIGFTNGIAVLIGLSQVKDFLGLTIDKMPAGFFGQIESLASHVSTFNPYAFGVALVSFLVIMFWPKGYAMNGPAWKRWIAHLPGTVIVLVLSTVIVSAFNLPVETIGSKFGGIPQKLPDLAIPDLSFAALRGLVGPMLTIALLGAIESLLCARVSDAMTDDRHDPNQELMGQGIANFIVPFFGGIPATGTIARTVTNIKSGAASPIAGVVHAVTLLVVILAAAPLASDIPLAALAAILMFVSWNMGNWKEFSRLKAMTMSYKVTLVTTFLLTVIFDLTVAVEVGLVISCVFFIYRMNTLTRVVPETLPFDMPAGVEAWKLTGALFFGSVSKLEGITDPKRLTAKDAAKVVILDFTDLLNIDNSAMDILAVYIRALKRRGHELIIAGASGHPLRQLNRTGIAQTLGANMVPDKVFADKRARDLIAEMDKREENGKPTI